MEQFLTHLVKRPFQLMAEIQDKDAEIERLKAIIERFNETIEKRAQAELGMIAEVQEHYKSLLARAADALEAYPVESGWNLLLIDDLRKAAE